MENAIIIIAMAYLQSRNYLIILPCKQFKPYLFMTICLSMNNIYLPLLRRELRNIGISSSIRYLYLVVIEKNEEEWRRREEEYMVMRRWEDENNYDDDVSWEK